MTSISVLQEGFTTMVSLKPSTQARLQEMVMQAYSRPVLGPLLIKATGPSLKAWEATRHPIQAMKKAA
jgi:hypothetical protein